MDGVAANTAGDRFGAWADDLASAFVRLEPSREDNGAFRGRIAQTKVGGIGVSRVEASSHDVSRLAEHARAEDGDVYFVNLELRGRSRTTQRGRAALAGPGDLTAVDAAEAFRIDHPGVVSLISFTLPRSRAPEALVDTAAMPLSRSDHGRKVAATLTDYADLALRRDGPALPAVMGAHIVDLIAYAVDLPRPLGGGDARRDMIEAYIRRNLASGDLGAAEIAAAFGVATRTVHKTFAAEGDTVSRYVNNLRLDRAAAALRDSDATIAAIAYGVGYRDLSYFNRRFHRRFGASPRDWRAGMRDRP